MTNLNEDILNPDDSSQSVEADEPVSNYVPETEDQVVTVEPKIITIGRVKRKNALRDMQN